MVKAAARAIKKANRTVAFTGAGISIESGIPPFRGDGGLWSKFDPVFLDVSYFHDHPLESWKLIKEIFYDFFGQAEPNAAHYSLATMEKRNLLQAIITQNIDNLHQQAGSKTVYEFHGTSQYLVCQQCNTKVHVSAINLSTLPPHCQKCQSVLKPDFVFFGESIPEPTNMLSFQETEIADVFIVIGTTGEIMPASMIPTIASKSGATIIEINPHRSKYTDKITDIFIQEKATTAMTQLMQELLNNSF